MDDIAIMFVCADSFIFLADTADRADTASQRCIDFELKELVGRISARSSLGSGSYQHTSRDALAYPDGQESRHGSVNTARNDVQSVELFVKTESDRDWVPFRKAGRVAGCRGIGQLGERRRTRDEREGKAAIEERRQTVSQNGKGRSMARSTQQRKGYGCKGMAYRRVRETLEGNKGVDGDVQIREPTAKDS